MKRFHEEDGLSLVDPFGTENSVAPLVDPSLPVPPAAGDIQLPGANTPAPDVVVPPEPAAITPEGEIVPEGDVLTPDLFEDDQDFASIAPELGDFPNDVTSPTEAPIVLDDVDVEDDIYSPDNMLESKEYVAKKSFRLPENRKVVVSRGDTLVFVGKAKQGLPKFAESTFQKALNILTEKKAGTLVAEGNQEEKIAIIGNSCLFEATCDWMLPGTNLIVEKGDLYQVISTKPIREAEDPEDKDDEETDDKDGKEGDDKDSDDKKEEGCGKSKKEAATARTGSPLREKRGLTFGVSDQY